MRRRFLRGPVALLACLAIVLLGAGGVRAQARARTPRAPGAAGTRGTSAPARRAAPRPPALAASSSAALLFAPETGQVLYALHPDRELAIASTTKLMTALVTLEHVRRLDTPFTQTDYYPAPADSQIGLVPGERMTVHDLLVALMLPSADDAAVDLAFNVGHGSIPAFVAMMNAQARRLGLRGTHYTTPSGLDTPGNHSTAADLVRLADYDLAHYPVLRRIVALPSAVLRSGSHLRRVVNTNDLVGKVRWIDGIKTGHTLQAGYVLVAAGHRDGMRLVSAVLGAPSAGARDGDTLALLDYGFSAFHLVEAVRRGAVIDRVPIDGRSGHATLIAAAGFVRVLPRGAGLRIEPSVPPRVKGPEPGGTPVGSVVVLVDGRAVARLPLVLAQAVPAPQSSTLAATLGPASAVVALLALAGAGLLGLRLQRRRLRSTPRRRMAGR